MFTVKTCVRCGQMPEDHPVHSYIERDGGWPTMTHCPAYVPPAPWWLVQLNKLLGRAAR